MLLGAMLVATPRVGAAEAPGGSALSVCTGPRLDGTAYVMPDGPDVTLGTTPAAGPRCANLPLDLPRGFVEAAWLAPEAVVRTIERGVVLVQAPGGPARTDYLEAVPDPGPASAPAPLFANLLGGYTAHAFGAEGRAMASLEGGRLTLACTAGEAPAGATLAGPDWSLPTARGLALAIERQGDGFELALSDAGRRRSEQPLPVGKVPGGGGRVLLPVPSRGLTPGDPLSLTLACPREAARTVVSSLTLVAESAARPDRHGTWVWEPQSWLGRPAALIDRARASGFDAVFVTVPVGAAGRVENPAELARLVVRAGAAGIAVWAVEGDPHAVLPRAREGFIARTRALAAYNRRAEPAARLAGLQYDIEPYLLPGFALAPAVWWERYADLVRDLRDAAAPMPVDLVVPFWLLGSPAGAEALDTMAAAIDRLTVMAYRTDAAAVQAIVGPMLAWGRRHERPVSVALELGPVPDEERITFSPAERGRLWAVAAGDRTALALLREPRANPSGRAFAEAGRTTFPGRAVSFLGDKEALRSVLPGLCDALLAHPAFGGIDLHGYLD